MPLKLDKLLSDADRAAFDELIARPGTTRRAAHGWFRDRGYDISFEGVCAYISRHVPGRKCLPKPLKIDRLVRGKDRAALEEMVADPGRTELEIRQFLRGRGYNVGQVAVHSHRQRWQKQLTQVKECARFAAALMEVAESVPADTHNRGALLGLDQVVLQQVFKLNAQEKLGAQDLTEWAKTLESFVGVRDQIETMQRKSTRARDKAAAGTAPAAEQPRRLDGAALSDKVRRILGVPLPGEPVPGVEPPKPSQGPEHQEAPAKEQQQPERAEQYAQDTNGAGRDSAPQSSHGKPQRDR